MLPSCVGIMAASSSTSNSSTAPSTPQEENPVSRQPIATAAGELVKCKPTGEMDWDTLGKVLTATALGEVLCLSYADFKYGRMTRGSTVDVDWKFAYEEKGVMVLKKMVVGQEQSKNSICFAGRGVLNLPVKHIAPFITDCSNYSKWNPFLVECRELEKLKNTETIKQGLMYFIHENQRCLVRAKRDFCVFFNGTYTDDGKFVHSGISIDHPSYPPVKGIIRAKVCLGSCWVLEPFEGNPSKTLVTYIANVDLCAPLPKSFASRLLQTQPLTIHYLKKLLKSQNQISRGLSSPAAKIESELETSLTSTVPITDPAFLIETQRSTLYQEQMGVDHFMGNTPIARRQSSLTEEDCSSGYTSRSNSRSRSTHSRSSSAWSPEPPD